MINTFNFGLLGENIGYSQSPAIFSAICDELGIEGHSRSFDVNSVKFETLLPELFKFADGFSVTIPYKAKIISFLDSVDPKATKINAVNSVCVKENKTIGYNTDCFGFAQPLETFKDQLKGKTALVLGNGGSARAVIYALDSFIKVSKIIIAGRDSLKTQSIIDEIQSEAKCETIIFSEISQSTLENSSLIINCTPLAGANFPDRMPLDEKLILNKEAIYYDLNYNVENIMIKHCQSNRLQTFDGSEMLVAQALKSFELWTGIKCDFDIIYHKVFKNGK